MASERKRYREKAALQGHILWKQKWVQKDEEIVSNY